MRIFVVLVAGLLLSGCELFSFLDQGTGGGDPVDLTWRKGTLTVDSPTKVFTIAVTPGTTYYLNWEDAYEQGSFNKFTADIKVSAYWTDLDVQSFASEEDSGWCGSTSYHGGEPGGAVDHTIVGVAPNGATTITIYVEPYGEGNQTGTFQIRWATTPLPGYGEVEQEEEA